MKPFLELVADHLYKKYGEEISNLILVFPNRRASLFFSKHLSKLISKPLWLPETTTVSDLMYTIAGVKPADPLILNYKLYKSYIEATKSLEPYDDFYFWGNVMLSDFDQIDKYLVDPKKLFSNINDLKVIEQQFNEFDDNLEVIKNFLNIISTNDDSQIRSRYSKIWENLYVVYQNFTDRLIAEGLVYEGLAYRLASNALHSSDSFKMDKNFVFVGFNALSKSETKLFEHLRKLGKAFFYWDYDEYYVNHSEHEAGVFMRQNLKEFPNELESKIFRYIGDSKTNKNVTLKASPSEVTQAKVIPSILDELGINDTNELTTAVVLPDEKLLLPLLTALPEKYSNANITMEYPLRETSAYSFVDALLTLQKQSDKQQKFYHKDVLLILSHPYLLHICPKDAEDIRETIIDQQQLNVSADLFKDNQLLENIFRPVNQGKELAEYLIACINKVVSSFTEVNDTLDDKLKFEVEYLLTINQALKRLNTVVSQIDEEYSNKTFRSYFTKALAEQRVSFIGQPLSGIQIMGFLETRNLDFENLIILSVNDNLLPGASFKPSFIVPSLRVAYGLPDYRHQNAIYAYYFYRLIQRAKNIYLIYTNKSDKTGEVSRFVQQLEMESGLTINKVSVSFELAASKEVPIEVQKDLFTDKLNRYLKGAENGHYLSPSALSEYKNCSLRFFFNRVKKIKAPDELEEELDALGIGSVLHKALELIYKDYEGKLITQDKVEEWLNDKIFISEKVYHAFKDISKFKGDIDDLNGRNRLLLERVIWMVRNTLEIDLRRVPYKLIELEKKVESVIPVKIDGEDFNVRLGGTIDRIEKKDGKYLIVDFKTGKYDGKKTSVSSIDDFSNGFDKDGVFQQMVYRYILPNILKTDVNNIDMQLWYVRNADKSYNPSIKIPEEEEFWNEFIDYLKELISSILSNQTTFKQTENDKNCNNCSFATICNRN
ncbi:PD-(D/E)XK nuclease family protein [Tenuifilum thalassicum]|uniref:PD-(D/E)XK endonuclease-like domain-containing protein n=1 Tax=Tenuifilum thalassicum TaxID=2590900 RepID=A0A7D4C8K5_9BACT|nr:PD-(D/E)XK nuclease family protein [Tenuifilum thalassicum]QKG79622.1 hypothetical protein FHG85_04880 [Tenuifilum thalassicum]